MTAATMLAGLLLSQATAPMSPAITPPITVAAEQERAEVGYRELASGRPDLAIERIRGNRALDANDPVALINLGAANAMLGNAQAARAAYRAAIASPDRYDVELANGEWRDSRAVARVALTRLENTPQLATR